MATFHYPAYSVHYYPRSCSCDVEVHLFRDHVGFLEQGHGNKPMRHVLFSDIDNEHLPRIRDMLDALADAVEIRASDLRRQTGEQCQPIVVSPPNSWDLKTICGGQAGRLYDYITRLEDWFFVNRPRDLPLDVAARRTQRGKMIPAPASASS